MVTAKITNKVDKIKFSQFVLFGTRAITGILVFHLKTPNHKQLIWSFLIFVRSIFHVLFYFQPLIYFGHVEFKQSNYE